MRLALILLLIPALALSAAESHSVSGQVEDPSGLAIPAARVVLGEQAVLSGVAGEFKFEDVPRGETTLRVEAPGFAVNEQTVNVDGDVELAAVRLMLEEVRTSVDTVVAVETADPLDPAQNRDATVLDRDTLNSLPVLDGDPLAAAGRFLDPVGLGAEEAPTLVVDGIETDELGVPDSEIEEVRVQSNPYSAEFSRPGGGRMEVITRSGGSRLRGTLRARLRDSSFDARNAFAPERPDQQRRGFEGALTMPLAAEGRDSLVLSAEREDDDRAAVIYAQTLDGLVQQTFPNSEAETEWAARWIRRLDRHGLTLRYSEERERAIGEGVGDVTLPEAAYSGGGSERRFSFDHRWFPRSDFFTQIRLRYETENAYERSENFEPRIVVEEAFTSGGAQRDARENEREVEAAAILSWMKGKHVIRAGVLIPGWGRYGAIDRNDLLGVYRFASLADFAADRPYVFEQAAAPADVDFWMRRSAFFIQEDARLTDRLSLGVGVRYERQQRMRDAGALAPRASLAWAADSKGETVVRIGAGMFYDDLWPGIVSDALLFGPDQRRLLIVQSPSYPIADAGGAGSTPPSVVQIAPDIRPEAIFQTSAGVERRLGDAVTIAAQYIYTRGSRLLRSLDRNAPLPPDYVRPDATVGRLRVLEDSGTLKSHAFRVNIRARFGERLTGGLRYTLGRAYDDAPRRQLPPSSYDLRGQWSRSDFDRRHRVQGWTSIAMPWGFEIGTILEAETGRPIEHTLGLDLNNDGEALERPPGVGRNAVQGPGSLELDVRLARQFRFGDGDDAPELTMSFDAFNAINRVNFERVVGNESSPFFGQPVSADSARRLQLTARLEF